MSKFFEIGSIVLIQGCTKIFKAMIVQKDIFYEGKEYDYRVVTYPECFDGVDSFFFINHQDIFCESKVYDSENPLEQNSKKLVPSSIIVHNDVKYIIIGKNVKYLGKELENEYAILEYGTKDNLKIEYILEKDIQHVDTYGFINYEYEELEEVRYKQMNLSIRKFMSFLPIGSIIELISCDGETIEVMIIGRNIKVDAKEVVDYIGVRQEIGYIGNDYVFKFDKDQIANILYMGYFHEDESEYNVQMLRNRDILNRS